MTDTLTVGSIVQLTDTAGRRWAWHAPLVEDVIKFGTLPDPRDARIAELEAALRGIISLLQFGYSSEDAQNVAHYALAKSVPAPEGDMTLTVEDLPA